MLFLIPARAGSKRLPGKNARLFCGIPLWEWSCATACRVAADDDYVVVSSNDHQILEQSFVMRRPEELCRDESTTQELVDWIYDKFPSQDSICLLQPTSPTRSDSLVRMMIAHGGQVRSVTNGQPNGQCWVYRKGHAGWIDIETEHGHDIDTLEDFQSAEQDMLRRFA
jgi:CMP-N,N'-diacetyllegionaminic acid synthase